MVTPVAPDVYDSEVGARSTGNDQLALPHLGVLPGVAGDVGSVAGM